MTTPLRLALLVDSTTVPAWIARIAQRLAPLDHARAAFIIDAQTPPKQRTLLDSFLALDQRIQRGASDFFVPSDLRSVLPNIPVIRVSEYQPDQVDILISFCEQGTGSSTPVGIPRLGIWTWNSLAPSTGFHQVLTRAPILSCDLRAQLPGGESKLLRRATFATDWISVARNRNHFFIKAASTLMWALKKLSLEGEETFFQQAETQHEQQKEKEPGITEIAALAMKQAARKLEKYVRPRETWLLLAAKTPAGLVPALGATRPIVPPRGVYWADPMAVERDGRVHVFVEEYVREVRRGRIVCLTLDEQGHVAERQVALEQPYHLSYPFVFEWRGEMYMIPETSARRSVEVYHCTRWPDRWEFTHNLMNDLYAVDSTLLEHGGRWWLFINLKSEPGASSWDELHLFYADSPLATHWTPHPLNPVIADVRLARPAGRIIEFEGRLYRPSQDCSVRYGYALNFNRIDTLTERAYAETRVETLHPRPGMLTLHTFTRSGGWDITDGATRNLL